MTAKSDDKSKLNLAILECQRLNIEVLPPNINKSDITFRPLPETHQILFGFSAINGIGSSLSNQIIEARSEGKFTSTQDLTARVPMSTAAVITLIKAGAIPCRDKQKAIINYLKSTFQAREYKPVKSLPTHAVLIEKWGLNPSEYKHSGKVDKEALTAKYNALRKAEFDAKEEERWKKFIEENSEKYLQDRQYWEFETLQSFISEPNPFKEAYEILPNIDTVEVGSQCIIAGIVSKVQKKKTKSGSQYAYINIYGTALIECLVWPNVYAKRRDLLEKGNQVVLKCTKEDGQMVINDVKQYQDWIKKIKKFKNLL